MTERLILAFVVGVLAGWAITASYYHARLHRVLQDLKASNRGLQDEVNRSQPKENDHGPTRRPRS